jgi:uncharacterized protein (TIGR02466 family)
MEKDIIHTLLKVEILEGKSNVNLDELSKLILSTSSQRLSSTPHHSSYEDCYCPDSPLIDQVVDEMKESIKKFQGLTTHVINKWGHIHEKNMSTKPHDHLDSHLSSVLHVKVPEGSGYLVFEPQLHRKYENAYLRTFPPKEGTYYIFPSFLKHYVTRNESDDKRISLSFNFTITK